jgi:hypothetical protein
MSACGNKVFVLKLRALYVKNLYKHSQIEKSKYYIL